MARRLEPDSAAKIVFFPIQQTLEWTSHHMAANNTVCNQLAQANWMQMIAQHDAQWALVVSLMIGLPGVYL